MAGQTVDKEQVKDGVQPVSMGLKRSLRVTFWFLSLLALGAGSVAVFLSSNQAGTVALLVLGGAALVMAISGRMPLRWAFGNSEINLAEKEAAEASAAILSGVLSGEEMDELALQLSQVSPRRQPPLARALHDQSAFEERAEARVRYLASEHGWEYEAEPRVPTGEGVGARLDGLVKAADGHSAYVEYKLNPSRKNFRNRINELLAHSAMILPHQKLIAVLSGSGDVVPLRGVLARNGVSVLFLDAEDFDEAFVSAVDGA